MPNKRCPDCKSCKVCAENVENVVNPPQNPTAASRYQSPLDKAITTPINSEPMAFVVMVAISDDIARCVASSEIPYRAMLPNAPPVPTNIKSRIMIILFYKDNQK